MQAVMGTSFDVDYWRFAMALVSKPPDNDPTPWKDCGRDAVINGP
jgi:hypothetical protein